MDVTTACTVAFGMDVSYEDTARWVRDAWMAWNCRLSSIAST